MAYTDQLLTRSPRYANARRNTFAGGMKPGLGTNTPPATDASKGDASATGADALSQFEVGDKPKTPGLGTALLVAGAGGLAAGLGKEAASGIKNYFAGTGGDKVPSSGGEPDQTNTGPASTQQPGDNAVNVGDEEANVGFASKGEAGGGGLRASPNTSADISAPFYQPTGGFEIGGPATATASASQAPSLSAPLAEPLANPVGGVDMGGGAGLQVGNAADSWGYTPQTPPLSTGVEAAPAAPAAEVGSDFAAGGGAEAGLGGEATLGNVAGAVGNFIGIPMLAANIFQGMMSQPDTPKWTDPNWQSGWRDITYQLPAVTYDSDGNPMDANGNYIQGGKTLGYWNQQTGATLTPDQYAAARGPGVQEGNEDIGYTTSYAPPAADYQVAGNPKMQWSDIQSRMGAAQAAGQASPGCFITEAVTSSSGQDDNAEELQVLRAFRDNVMLQTPQGQALVQEYYALAPVVVEEISARPDGLQIFQTIKAQFIDPAVEAVKAGDQQKAFQIYASMIGFATQFVGSEGEEGTEQAGAGEEPMNDRPVDTNDMLADFGDHATVLANSPEMASQVAGNPPSSVPPGLAPSQLAGGPPEPDPMMGGTDGAMGAGPGAMAPMMSMGGTPPGNPTAQATAAAGAAPPAMPPRPMPTGRPGMPPQGKPRRPPVTINQGPQRGQPPRPAPRGAAALGRVFANRR